jgi:hypothetical protein
MPTPDEYAGELTKLRNAIREHRAQKADDRCIEDDDKLYAALGDGIKCDRRVGDQCAMLENCKRYIERRTEPGGWATYAELEQLLRDAREAFKARGCTEWVELIDKTLAERPDVNAV